MNEGAAPSVVPATCLLVIGDRVALRANGPPEAEYALFEIGDIELRASEPGRVREHGYQTTVEEARLRLTALGITTGAARELVGAMQPVLSVAYARGDAVKRVAHTLGPRELFQAEIYDAQAYRGVFLDLAALARDLGIDHAGATLHACYLATLLEGEAASTTVALSTDGCTKGSKPGARTYKRATFTDVRRLRDALGELAIRAPQPIVGDALPRADVIAFLRERADAATSEEIRQAYVSLEGTVSLREQPEKGPLAEPDLWAIETRIETGDLAGLVEAIDQAEQRHGRTPGTTYLRARAALALKLDSAEVIAERVSALALSMSSFQELALLAAEAWLDADDPRRALPFARDLVDSPGLDEGLLLRAQRLVARSVGAAPARASVELRVPTPSTSIPLDAVVAVAPPPLVLEPPELDFVVETGRHTTSRPSAAAPARPSVQPHEEIVRIPANVKPAAQPPRTPSPPFLASPSSPSSPSRPAASPSLKPALRAPLSAPAFPSVEPPSIGSRRNSPAPHPPAVPTLEMPVIEQGASFSFDLPGPQSEPQAEAPPRSVAPQSSPRPSRRPRLSGVMMETKPPASFDPRAEPDSPLPAEPVNPLPRTPSLTPASPRLSSPAPARRSSPAPARRPTARPESPPPEARRDFGRDIHDEVTPVVRREHLPPFAEGPRPGEPRSSMHGASLPPYERDSSGALVPRMARGSARPEHGEVAEHLSLPPGVGGQPRAGDPLPPALIEVRVQFTQLSRELGREFRLKRSVELRADVSGIEAMQSALLETFPDHVVTTREQQQELRRYGAFLSEILVRHLDAQWLDTSPEELGYWAMIVPPETRVWPFGRVARFVSMGHKERDLVSYFLELESRARSR